MASKNVKKRNWVIIVYPDSAPSNWREQLRETGLLVAISPLHDKDVHDDGSPKKPHYHVILCYAGPTSYTVVKRLTDHLRTVVPQPLESIRGTYRYFTHMDDPDKYQYDARDIVRLNGFDIRDFVELTKTEVEKIKGEIFDYIVENKITEYVDLISICRTDDAQADWFGVASSHTMFFEDVIRSQRYKLKGRRD